MQLCWCRKPRHWPVVALANVRETRRGARGSGGGNTWAGMIPTHTTWHATLTDALNRLARGRIPLSLVGEEDTTTWTTAIQLNTVAPVVLNELHQLERTLCSRHTRLISPFASSDLPPYLPSIYSAQRAESDTMGSTEPSTMRFETGRRPSTASRSQGSGDKIRSGTAARARSPRVRSARS